MYQKIIVRIIYLATKILIEESNRVRELVAKQFGNPNEEHWLELA
jgi:hypothetical protein